MATVQHLLDKPTIYYEEFQLRSDGAEQSGRARWRAAVRLQRAARGMLVRSHVARLHRAALRIQTAMRVHLARAALAARLRSAAIALQATHYAVSAAHVQAAWRGLCSRKNFFCYYTYRRWLADVSAESARRVAEADACGACSGALRARALEREARHWLAFLAFKLHHLLRTAACAGIYSLPPPAAADDDPREPQPAQLSEVERLLAGLHFSEYMRRCHPHPPPPPRPLQPDAQDRERYRCGPRRAVDPAKRKAADTRGHAAHYDPALHPAPFLWRGAL